VDSTYRYNIKITLNTAILKQKDQFYHLQLG
jgi:hypothetical protein